MQSEEKKTKEKFSTNWEGPFRIQSEAKMGSYQLQHLSRKQYKGPGTQTI